MTAKAFLLYLDNKPLVDKLTDAQAGKLFKAIYQYEQDGTTPVELCALCDMVFTVFKLHLDRGRADYANKVEQRRAAGRKGGLAKASNTKQPQAKQANINIKRKSNSTWV